ncbi:MAG: ABC transporter ATP-binding protein [Acetobacteraceae bacterium]|nr:ABC transporter ATP-binding protein [Acetobacteraceae bacterium]
MLWAAGLCKHYRSGNGLVQAVSDVSLRIGQGEFVAIQGRSGSGKSTLMYLLGLLQRPDAGQYTLQGRPVETLSEDMRAAMRNSEIGFVFQMPALLPRATAIENVALPLVYAGYRIAERRRRAGAALERVGLARRTRHWPHQLSGGEQQRVVIARAIIARPALILADEPTGALDSNTSDEILTLFYDLNKEGRTIVVVTHDPEVAGRARRRITLHDGRIVQDNGMASESICRARSCRALG